MAQLKSTITLGNLAVTGDVVADKLIKNGGTADQLLCADGSTKNVSDLEAGGNLQNSLTVGVYQGSLQEKTFNGSTALTVGTQSSPIGYAYYATHDSNGANIASTYLSKTDAGNTYATKEETDGFATSNEGIYYVEGTGTTAGTWLGDNSRIENYYDGLTILYKTNIAGAGTTTLNINGLGAKTVYRYGTTKLTTHYAVNTVVLLAYMEDLNSGCWMVIADYDTNTVDQIRPSYARFYTANALYDYKICGVDKDGKLRPLTLETGTGTSKTVNTAAIRPHEFYYYNTTTDVSAGAIVGANNLYNVYSHTTFAYTFNSTGTAYNEIYLKGTLDKTTGLFTLDNSSATSWYVLVPYNTTITLSNYFSNGSYYILLGRTYSSNNYFCLYPNHPLYKFDGTNLREVVLEAISAEKAIADEDGNSIKNTYETKSSTQAGIQTLVTSFQNGTVTVGKATADGDGNNIANTYQKKLYLHRVFGTIAYSSSASFRITIEYIAPFETNAISNLTKLAAWLYGSGYTASSNSSGWIYKCSAAAAGIGACEGISSPDGAAVGIMQRTALTAIQLRTATAFTVDSVVTEEL